MTNFADLWSGNAPFDETEQFPCESSESSMVINSPGLPCSTSALGVFNKIH